MIFCDLIQSIIRTVIVSVFLFKFLIIMGKQNAAKITFFTYLIGVLLFDFFIMIDIFSGSHRISCNDHIDWQIQALIGVDTA